MPVDRGAIDAQLRAIGEGERWWEQREFRDLPHILHAEESIAGIVRGKLLGRRRPRLLPAGSWLIVATDQRLIFLKQERFARKQVEIAAGQITRLRQSSRFRSYRISIDTPKRRYRVRIHREDAFRFTAALAPLVPETAVQRIPAELDAWAWLPGITTVANLPGFSGIVSKVGMLSPPDYATRTQLERLETTVDRLQTEVEQLQEQVVFLEDLLHRRGEEAYLPGPGAPPA